MSTHHPNFGKSSGFGSVFKSWTSSLKSTTKNVPVQINPTVVGGSSDQQKLFIQLKSGTLPQRASAAVRMTESLEKFAISSIPEIWYLARDMCDSKIQSYIRRNALKLMIECIKNDDLTATGNRIMYYRDITQYCQLSDNKIDQEFDLFLKALRNLTSDGRDIQELVVLDDPRALAQFLILSLQVLGKQAKQYSEKDSEAEVGEEFYFSNCLKLISFIKNCIKFNAASIDEYHINQLVNISIKIGYSTTNLSFITSLVELLSSIVLITNVKQETLFDSVNFFCSVYGLSEQITSLSWHAISILSTHGTFFMVNNCLCDIISNEELQSFISNNNSNMLSAVTSNTTINTLDHKFDNASLNSCLGAIQIMEKLIVTTSIVNTHNDSVFFYFLLALKKTVSFEIAIINTTLLRTLDRLFSKQVYEAYNIEVNTNKVMEQVYSFQLWYSTKSSIYELLNSLKVITDIDASYLQSICSSLQKSYENYELKTSKEKLINFFLCHYQYIPKSTIKFIFKYYQEEKLLTVLNPLWSETVENLLSYFYFTDKPRNNEILVTDHRDSGIKIELLKTIKAAFDISITIHGSSVNYDLVNDILLKSVQESDEEVLQFLIEEFLVKMVEKLPFEFLSKFHQSTMPFFEIKIPQGRLKSYVSLNSSGKYPSSQISSQENLDMSLQFMKALGKGISKVLLIQSTLNARKAQEAFRCIIMIAHHGLANEYPEILLILMKTLVRLRTSEEGYIYFTNLTDSEGLSTAFKRNRVDGEFQENQNYKWSYPETIDYIDHKYFDKPIKNLKLFNPMSEKLHLDDDFYIDMADYFSIVLDIMDNFVEWELYSYIWAHFCPQLANMKLFNNNKTQILRLKTIICEQLMLNFQKNFTLPDGFLKSHLQVAFVRSFSALLGYREFFTKYDDDDIIRSLLFGIDSWESTAIPSIHILTICCFEMPLSIKKYLSSILGKIQTKITSTFASSHILEFLMALINLPSLTSNFHTDDIKRIFAIAFKFIQHSKDAIKNTEKDVITPDHSGHITTDNTPSTSQANQHSSILLQYVLTLSYNVISTWFLQIEMTERKQLTPFLIKNLVLLNNKKEDVEDQILVLLDLIIRFTYSDLPLKIINPNVMLSKFQAGNGDYHQNSWIVGNIIVSVCTNSNNGESLVILRRPTGVSVYTITLHEDMFPFTEKFDVKTLFNPSYILLQGYSNLDINGNLKPIPLIEDSVTSRAISTFDRIPIVEFHKLGIIYIGKDQLSENEVLGNKAGSNNYQQFLESMGELIKLKDCRDIYVGGLDTENDTDGKYALYWNDKTIQVIFHTITLMPNNERDPYFDLKKRHIGNNYVNIFFDESGLSFNFNIIKSQFNFINIVISPHSKKFDYSTGDNEKQFYKVKTYRRSGVPGVFATCHFKIVSIDLLPILIRNLSITANQFANVWHANYHGSYISNWAHRVKQLKILKDRTYKHHETLKQEQFNDNDLRNINDATQSFLQQLQFDGGDNETAVISRYQYLSNEDHPLYKTFEFNSYTN
ncbi:putative tuberous sclerosis 2 protein homolog [[Candida] jaroonii]|uniref:Tuberous sclerosis 2 protein homolog n=1 Tax=[Candida] jaroonii TaxID=467808 RepID=A0ACA9Y4W6_9ASCO|nr:putative tuberous sclerosis 2 protein homolog [[Candida] jaroonii]